MLVYNFTAMKPCSSKQYFYLSLLLACRIIESDSTPSELKDCLYQYRSAGLSRLARGGRPFCVLIKVLGKKRKSSLLESPQCLWIGEDLFVFKVKSFSSAGGDCWGRLQGQNADVWWLLQIMLWAHSLQPQAPHPCRLLFISLSFSLISHGRSSHKGYDRSQTVAVMELCLSEPPGNLVKAFKHLIFFFFFS